MLKGKRMSILGDSVSTYKGASNDASANFSTSYNPYFYRLPFPLEKTYWSLILDKFGMSLCVNNSWSGGNLSGIDDESSGVNRASQLSYRSRIFPLCVHEQSRNPFLPNPKPSLLRQFHLFVS